MNQLPSLLSLAVITSWLVAVPTASPTVFVVPSPATPTIGAALALAVESGDIVDVLPGTYFERELSIREGVLLRGVAGAAATIVDAQGLGRVIDEGTGYEIQGLTITHGAAQHGAGILWPLWVTIRECVITDNHATGSGGGISMDALGGIPLSIFDTVFSNNSAAGNGGAFWVHRASLTVARCTFEGNTAGVGGVALVSFTSGTIDECMLVANTATTRGGGFNFAASSSVSIRDCTFYGNAAPIGGAISADLLSSVARTIICNTTSSSAIICGSATTFSCCDIFGNSGGNALCGTDGGGNVSSDPLFCDAAGGDFRLHEDSPCLPGQHPDEEDCGGTIGALDVGCGSGTGVDEEMEATSWSRVKMRYR